VVYLVVAAIAGSVFLFCSFWIYHFIDLDHDTNQLAEARAEDIEDAVGADQSQSLRDPERDSRIRHELYTARTRDVCR
jgi:hypothetical protein